MASNFLIASPPPMMTIIATKKASHVWEAPAKLFACGSILVNNVVVARSLLIYLPSEKFHTKTTYPHKVKNFMKKFEM
jgi:hypothetical protein